METYEARELIHRCATLRDADLWQVFIDRFGSRLRAGVRRALLRCDARVSEDEREDLMQEVYCRLLEKRGRRLRRCRGEVDPAVSAYLSKVAESAVLDYLRARSAAKRGNGQLIEAAPERGFDVADRAVDAERTPEQKLLFRERNLRFFCRCRQVVGDRTPKRDLLVLYLAFVEGCTSREICRRLGRGLTPSAVDSLVHRLRRRLARQGVEVPRRCPGVSERTEIDSS